MSSSSQRYAIAGAAIILAGAAYWWSTRSDDEKKDLKKNAEQMVKDGEKKLQETQEQALNEVHKAGERTIKLVDGFKEEAMNTLKNKVGEADREMLVRHFTMAEEAIAKASDLKE